VRGSLCKIAIESEHFQSGKSFSGFAAMPHEHMFVIAQLILDVATPDISKADEIRTTLKDIWDIRQSKLRLP
jgi:hypothetical protein